MGFMSLAVGLHSFSRTLLPFSGQPLMSVCFVFHVMYEAVCVLICSEPSGAW